MLTAKQRRCPARRPHKSHAVKTNADPVMRAKVELAASEAMKRWWDGKRLPSMTPRQRWKYRTIREMCGRDVALQQALGST
jgi:hypothetical protein